MSTPGEPVLSDDPVEREKEILRIATRAAAQASAVGDLAVEVRSLIEVVEQKNEHVEQLTSEVKALRADLGKFQTSEQVSDTVTAMEGREKKRRFWSIVAVCLLVFGMFTVQRLDEKNNCDSRNKLRTGLTTILAAAGVFDETSPGLTSEQVLQRRKFVEKITPVLTPEHCDIW